MLRKDIEELSLTERESFNALIEKYRDQFMMEGWQIGRTSIIKHKIQAKEHTPIKQRPRRKPLGMKDVIKEELQKMGVD